MKKIATSFFITLIFSLTVSAQSIVGKWKTIDDETNKERSIVEVYEEKGKYYGKIIKIFYRPDEKPSGVCDKCTDDRKGKVIEGMQIIRGLEKDDDEFKNGTILDPKNGKVYDCKIWLEDGLLKVRGYIAFLYRTQTWKKHE
ncbi:MAG: DUF2147 domain-containing protein [Cytophagales bacterium]|nr:MAG: DUF2147 domain-containing protein [Cytophagales bacterium]